MEWYTAAEQFTEALSTPSPTPGGGAAAAQTGAMGCALILMAIGTTLKRKNLHADAQSRLETSQKRLGALKTQLQGYVRQDAQAYTAFRTACHLPKENPARPEALQQALYFAARVPADAAYTALEALEEIQLILPDVSPAILADAACAKHLLQASVRCAVENIRANLALMQDGKQKTELEKRTAVLLKSC